MEKIYCDICEKEIKEKIDECRIRLEEGYHIEWKWDLCPLCKIKMYDSIDWLTKDY